MASGTTTRLGMNKELLGLLLPSRAGPASDREIAYLQTKQEQKALCALLPSPELLSIGSSSGSDKSNTLKDYYDFYKWAKEEIHENLLPLEFTNKSETGGRQLEKGEYNSMIKTAFQLAFDPIRNAIQPEGLQLVLWYYAGHGVDESICDEHYSATPLLKMNDWDGTSIYQRSDYICERIKGGELFLNHVGFCNLRALIQPWIVAVKANSTVPDQQKKNKHLVVILDSCHSGEQVNDLEKMKSEGEDQPWNTHEGCSVTVQASCRGDETVAGGYFTPLFLYLNTAENEDQLKKLEKEWHDLSHTKKDDYKKLPGSSPMISTTLDQPTDVPVFKPPETEKGFTLNLFPDPRFFKFCYLKIFGPQEVADNQRLLSPERANVFLQESNGEFRVVNYKLKMDSHNTPLGLFLMGDTKNRWSNFSLCAHIHYSAGSTNLDDIQCINLVHHHKTSSCFIDEDEDTQQNYGKIMVFRSHPKLNTDNAVRMAQECETYVRSKKKHNWDDLSNWNMNDCYKKLYLNSLNIPKICAKPAS